MVPEDQRPSLDDPEAWVRTDISLSLMCTSLTGLKVPYRYIPSKGAATAFTVLFAFTQRSGGSIQAGGCHKLMLLGEKVIIVGLFIQVAVFGFFMVVAGVFHYHLVNDKPSTHVFPPTSKNPRARLEGRLLCSTAPVDTAALPWMKHIYLLYAASALVMIRSVFVSPASTINPSALSHLI